MARPPRTLWTPYRGILRPSGPSVLNRGSLQAQALTSFWPLTGLRSIDLVRGNDAGVVGAPTWSFDAQFGLVPVLSGSGQYFRLTVAQVLAFGGEWSISAWLKVGGAGNCSVFGDGNGFARVVDSSGSVYISNDANQSETTTGWTAGAWTHVVLTGDNLYFVNGGLGKSLTRTGNFTFRDIGRGYSTYYFNGPITHVCLHGKNLSATEIWHQYDPATRWDLYWERAKSYSLPNLGGGDASSEFAPYPHGLHLGFHVNGHCRGTR